MQIKWHEINTLKSGLGTASVVEISDIELLCDLLSKHRGQSGFRVLGYGSNLIGSDIDTGYTVVRLKRDGEFGRIVRKPEGDVIAGGACSLRTLADSWCRLGYGGGMAKLAGIPGTLGGALKMNAGANGVEMSRFVIEMHGVNLKDGVSWEWCIDDGKDGWGYRRSPVPDDVVITEAVLQGGCFNGEADRPEDIVFEMNRRASATPRGRSAGSIFRNPSEGSSAGKLLELAGCKGLAIGNAKVSEEHANWIVNVSGEPVRSSDILFLMHEMCQRVEARFGVKLVPEVRIADGNGIHSIGELS